MTFPFNATRQDFFSVLERFGAQFFLNISYNNSYTDEPIDGETGYYSDTLYILSRTYMKIHGYLSLIVCMFGIPTSIINIFVLTRSDMLTPVNCILTWMAVSDLLTMTSYVPFAIHFYCLHPPDSISKAKNSYSWMQFLLFHVNCSAITHTISVWLGVSLAIFRFKHIHSPAKGNLTRMRRLIRARVVVVIIVCLSGLLMIPNYLSNKLQEIEPNSSVYILRDPMLGTTLVKPLMMVNMLLYSTCAKLLPCILMIVYGGLLLRTLNSKFRLKRQREFRKRG